MKAFLFPHFNCRRQLRCKRLVLLESNTKSDIAFGRVLRRLRKASYLTQENLAFDATVARTYVSLLERGLRSPSLNTMLSLCKAMHIAFPVMAEQITLELEIDD